MTRPAVSGGAPVQTGGTASRARAISWPRGLPTSLSGWLFATSLCLASLNDLRVTATISYCDVLFAMAAAAALVERAVFRERVVLVPAYLLAIVLLSFSYFADVLFGCEGSCHKTYAVVTLSTLLTPLAIAQMRIRDLDELRFMLYAWSLGGLIGALFVIGFVYGYFPDHVDLGWRYHHKARGLTPLPNQLGINCVLALPGLLTALARARAPQMRFVVLGLIALVLKGIDYSGSRAAIVIAILLMLLWIMLSWRVWLSGGQIATARLKPTLLWTSVITAAVAVYLLFDASDLVSNVWSKLTIGDRVSDSWRSELNAQAFTGFMSNPLFGEGLYWLGYDYPHVAHNTYLRYLQATGVFGFATLMIGLLYPMAYAWRHWLSGTPGGRSTENRVLLAGALALLVWLWAQSGSTDFQPQIVFGLLLLAMVQGLYGKS